MSPPIRVHPPRRRAGFTFVELLVIVVILGLMGGLAMSTKADDDAVALDLVQVQIEDATSRARALALSNRIAYGVVFDVNDDRFAVVDEFGTVVTHPIHKQDWIVDFAAVGQVGSIDVAAADFGDAGTAMMFDSDGTPVEGGSVVLQRNDVRLTLTFDAATGELTSSAPAESS